MAKKFESATAFKAALEARLRKRAEETQLPLSTLQLKFVIERLLARLFRNPDPAWLLKGGFAMDLRFRPRARTTTDVDLAMVLVPAGNDREFSASVRDQLQEAADQALGDYLRYRIGEPKQELTNAPGGGARYPCEAVLVGKVYARFHIDVGRGDPLAGAPERLVGTTCCRLPESNRRRCSRFRDPNSSPRNCTPTRFHGRGGGTPERKIWSISSCSSNAIRPNPASFEEHLRPLFPPVLRIRFRKRFPRPQASGRTSSPAWPPTRGSQPRNASRRSQFWKDFGAATGSVLHRER